MTSRPQSILPASAACLLAGAAPEYAQSSPAASADRCKGVNSASYTAFGRSKTVEGPFLAREGGDMLQGLGTVILRGDPEEHGRWPIALA